MRSPGDGSYYQSGNRWRVVVTVDLDANGKPIRKYLSGGPTEATAKANLRRALRDRDDGLITAGRDITVEQWLTTWLEKIIRPAVTAGSMSPRTYETYESLVRVWMVPHLGRIKLVKLKPDDLRALYNEMAAQDSRSMIHVHRYIRRALKLAVREGKLARNVAEMVDPPTVEPYEVEPFDEKAARAILTAAGKLERNSAAVPLRLALGLRQGEVLGLRWGSVDLDGGYLKVEWQLQKLKWWHGCGGTCGRKRGGNCPQRHGGGFVLRRPKSKASRRTLSIPPSLVLLLRKHKADQAAERLKQGAKWTGWQVPGKRGTVPADLVFARPDGGPIEYGRDHADWTELLKVAKVDHRRLHDARHTAATLLLVAGQDVKVVSGMLGHSTTTLTRDTYQHVPQKLNDAAAAAMERALWGDGS